MVLAFNAQLLLFAFLVVLIMLLSAQVAGTVTTWMEVMFVRLALLTVLSVIVLSSVLKQLLVIIFLLPAVQDSTQVKWFNAHLHVLLA